MFLKRLWKPERKSLLPDIGMFNDLNYELSAFICSDFGRK
jgi:hypothetical protein